MPLFKGHDPGFPAGRVVAARLFSHPSGTRFVVTIFGLYEDGQRLSFADLELDPAPIVSSPAVLDAPNENCWLDFATDPREVDAQWAEETLRTTPLRVEQIDLFNNAAESQGELIRIGLAFVVLVWNRFVTSIATEAGKDVYVAIRQWLRCLWNKLSQSRNPLVVVRSHYNGCEVSFPFRGKDVQNHYDAHGALPIAAAQAAKLIGCMDSKGAIPATISS